MKPSANYPIIGIDKANGTDITVKAYFKKTPKGYAFTKIERIKGGNKNICNIAYKV